MFVFLAWLCAALLFFSIYCAILWKHAQKRSRFRARLTILFLVLLLVPTIPLTFFLTTLLTQSANVLLLPGVSDALDTSLDVMRGQTDSRIRPFIRHLNESRWWTPERLEEHDIAFLCRVCQAADTLSLIRMVRPPKPITPAGWEPPWGLIRELHESGQKSRLLSVGDSSLNLILIPETDTLWCVAGYTVPASLVSAREKITTARNVYNALSLLKENIIEKNILWGISVLLIMGLGGLAIFVAGRLSRGISEPVTGLVEGMKRVAGGDLGSGISIQAKDEFQFLVDSFNQMTRELEIGRRRWARAERMAAWQDVARQISHEIKNSLTPISVALHRFRAGLERDGRSAEKESLQAVEEEFHLLEKMASEFSQFARLPKPQKSSVQINELVKSTTVLLQPGYSRIPIETRLDAALPEIEADREQMKQVIHNLVKNAVEASPERSPVIITTRRSDRPPFRITLEVADFGKGMGTEELSRLFQPYFTTKRRGTGLGMTIVQKIIEDHQGEILPESAENKGTTIRIFL